MRLGPVVLGLLVVSVLPASADWQIKPFVAAKFKGSTTLVDVEGAAAETKAAFGASVMVVGDMFGVEGDVARTPGYFQSGKRRSFFETTRQQNDRSSVTSITGSFVMTVPRRLTEYTLRPYLVAGAGVIRARAESTQVGGLLSFSRQLPAIDIGGGASGFLTDRLGVGWDVRYCHTIRGKVSTSGLNFGETEELSFWRVNMAFVVRLRHKTR